LVNDLLDVAKMEAGKFQILTKPTDFAKLIEAKVNSFAPLVGETKIKLETALEPHLPILEADEQKIGQVLTNLLSNSLKFTKDGKIVVSAFTLKAGQMLSEKIRSLNLDWPGVEEIIKYDQDQLVIAVTDTGIGIFKEQFAKLFSKFSQLEPSADLEKKGTGLGLVVSKGIVEAHGGTINLFSEVGKGTTFYFSLPIARMKPNT
jgi:signal transduction histidine kinase